MLHEQVVLLTVLTDDVPFVHPQQPSGGGEAHLGFYRVMCTLRFHADPEHPAGLAARQGFGLMIDPETVTYYIGRETLVSTKPWPSMMGLARETVRLHVAERHPRHRFLSDSAGPHRGAGPTLAFAELGDLRIAPMPPATFGTEGRMLGKLLALLAAFHHRRHLRPGLRRHCAAHGHRERLHPVAFRSHHAVLRLSGIPGELYAVGVALAGAMGCVLGSLVAYCVGGWGGRPLVEKYGRYLFISHHDLDLADRWFAATATSSSLSVACCRWCAPLSLFRRAWRAWPLPSSLLYTFIGSFIWCWMLAWVGLRLGEHWDALECFIASTL